MFSNTNINIENLPTVRNADFKPLNNKYHSVIMIRSGVLTIIALVLTVLAYYFVDIPEINPYKLHISALVIIILIIQLVVSYFGFYKKKYLIREMDILYKTGLFWQEETSIAYVRIQHSEVVQGPIDRMFGLAKLTLYTAGGSSSDLSIPGLSHSNATKLKDFIAKRIQNNKSKVSNEEE